MLKRLMIGWLALVAPMTMADTLLLDGIEVARETTHQRPARGTSMDGVQAQFGVPTSQQAAVGEPPITRWDYPAFIVYFEHNLVIHAVAAR